MEPMTMPGTVHWLWTTRPARTLGSGLFFLEYNEDCGGCEQTHPCRCGSEHGRTDCCATAREAGERPGDPQPLADQVEQHRGAEDFGGQTAELGDVARGAVVSRRECLVSDLDGADDPDCEEGQIAADDDGQGCAGTDPCIWFVGLGHGGGVTGCRATRSA